MSNLCCLGERGDPIIRKNQIAGYLCVSPPISMTIFWLRLSFAIICFSSKIFAIIFGITAPSKSYGNNFLIYFAYYTHWTFICQCIYWISVLYLHRQIYLNQEKQEKCVINPRLYWLMKVTNIFGVCAGIGLCVVYWAFIYNGPPFPGLEVLFFINNVFKHGLNAILMAIDFFLSLSIYRYKDVWMLMLYAITFQLFNFIYGLAGGVDVKGNVLYPIYDWNNNPSGAAVQVTIFIVAHFAGYLLAAFIKKIILNSYLSKQPDLDVMESTIDLSRL